MSNPTTIHSYSFLALFLLSSFLIFYNLGANSLHNHDEARFAEISREMLLTGDWITPHAGDVVYFRKPPLRFWLQMPLFHFFGYSEWVVRFWSAFSALGSVVFTVLLGKRLFGSAAGLWAGFSQCTSTAFLYAHASRSGEMDSLVLFFLTSSLFFLLLSEERKGFLFLSMVIMGLSSLTKNLAGMIPFFISLLYLAITGKWRKYPKSILVFSTILLLAVSFSWILVMIWLHGAAFINDYFGRQVFQRAFSDSFAQGSDSALTWSGNLGFIGISFLNGFFPWSLLMPLVAFQALDQIRSWKKEPQILPVIWFWCVLIGLLFFRHKNVWYLLPLIPAASLLIGYHLSEEMMSKRIRFLTGLFLIFGLVLFLPNDRYNPFGFMASEVGIATLRFKSNWKFAGLLCIGFTATWTFLSAKSDRASKIVLTTLLVLYPIFFAVLPLQYSSHQSEIHRLASSIGQIAKGPRNTLFLYNVKRNTIYGKETFWSQPMITLWYFSTIPRTRVAFVGESETALSNLFQDGGNKIFLIPEKDYRELGSKLPDRFVGTFRFQGVTFFLLQPAE